MAEKQSDSERIAGIMHQSRPGWVLIMHTLHFKHGAAILYLATLGSVLTTQTHFSSGVSTLETSQGLPSFVVVLPANLNELPAYSVTCGYCWKDFSKPRPDYLLTDIALRPRPDGSPRILLAGWTASEGIKSFRSGDLGTSWAEIFLPHVPSCATMPNASTHVVEYFPSHADSTLLYARAEGNCTGKPTAEGIAVSLDSGITWNIFRDWPGGDILSVVPSPVLPGRLYISVFIPETTWLFLRSDDYGQTFTPTDVIGLPDSQDTRILYQAGQRHIETQGWIPWASEPCSAYSLFVHPTLSMTLLAICGSSGTSFTLHLSFDGGDSWVQTASASVNGGLFADYSKPGRILWLRDGGMYASEDSGTSWAQVVNSWKGLTSCINLFLPVVGR